MYDVRKYRYVHKPTSTDTATNRMAFGTLNYFRKGWSELAKLFNFPPSDGVIAVTPSATTHSPNSSIFRRILTLSKSGLSRHLRTLSFMSISPQWYQHDDNQ